MQIQCSALKCPHVEIITIAGCRGGHHPQHTSTNAIWCWNHNTKIILVKIKWKVLYFFYLIFLYQKSGCKYLGSLKAQAWIILRKLWHLWSMCVSWLAVLKLLLRINLFYYEYNTHLSFTLTSIIWFKCICVMHKVVFKWSMYFIAVIDSEVRWSSFQLL